MQEMRRTDGQVNRLRVAGYGLMEKMNIEHRTSNIEC